MKVKCKGYIGYLEEIETEIRNIYGIPELYRVYIKINESFIDLRNVKLEEIEFIKEEKDYENND